MVADGEEGKAGWTGADEAEESVRVVDGGGIEERRYGFREGPDGGNYQTPPRSAAAVALLHWRRGAPAIPSIHPSFIAPLVSSEIYTKIELGN